MDTITAAIVVALANLSKDAIKDSYNALKTALKTKFGSDSDLTEAVEGLEKKPDSEARQAMVQEEVEIAKANEDSEIVQLAKALLEKADSDESSVNKYNVEFQGEVKGAQIGDKNQQENTFN
ncbi:hypothetical protein [Baaleninema simplex]|uniref:hypothetical protein n=1 Tax=Baaleninema simplex TaxID=2862350 RepID=UPI00034C8AB1|nr:hypothetical protein [Baaleninema simplex]